MKHQWELEPSDTWLCKACDKRVAKGKRDLSSCPGTPDPVLPKKHKPHDYDTWKKRKPKRRGFDSSGRPFRDSW